MANTEPEFSIFLNLQCEETQLCHMCGGKSSLVLLAGEILGAKPQLIVFLNWVWQACQFNHTFQALCFLPLSARESCYCPVPCFFLFFFLPLTYVDNRVRPYEYNLSLMQSNYLEMPVNTKLIQLT